MGSVVWLPERHIPSAAPTLSQLFDRKTQDALLTHRTTHLAQKTQTIAKEAQAVNLQVFSLFFVVGPVNKWMQIQVNFSLCEIFRESERVNFW